MNRILGLAVVLMPVMAACFAAEEQVSCTWDFEDGRIEGWRWKENASVEVRDDVERKSKVCHLTSNYAPFEFTWTTVSFPDRDLSGEQWMDFWIRGDGSGAVVAVNLGKTPPHELAVYYANTADAVTLDFSGWQRRRAWLHRFATPPGRSRSADIRAVNFVQFMVTSRGAKRLDIALDDIRIGAGGELPGDVELWQRGYARMESKEVPRDGSNLLPNGGFELHNGKSPSFWSLAGNWGGQAAVDTAVAHSGTASVRLACPEKRQAASCGIRRSILPGRYRLSAWYRTKGVPDIRRTGPSITVRYFDVDEKLCGVIEINLPPSEGQWTEATRSIPAPWNAVAVLLTLQTDKVAGEVWWDDVSLAWDVEYAQAQARQAEAADNLLGKAVMAMERCGEGLKALDDLQPADEAEKRAIALVKAAFQWSMDDAERAINSQMSDEARLDLEETLERIKNPRPIIAEVAESLRQAKPTALVEGNPYVQELDKHAAALKPVEKLRSSDAYVRTAPWPKGREGFRSVKDAWYFRSMGTQCFVAAWAWTRPECKGFGDAKLLAHVYCLLDAILSNHTDGDWIMGRSVPYHYDTNIQRFTLGPTLDAYWMVRERFPSLIPPRKKKFWEEQMALCAKAQYDTYGAENIETGAGGSGEYPNMDVYYLYIMEMAARVLNEPKYHQDSEKFMRFLQKKIYPMGATAYHGHQNECEIYHDLIVCIIARHYEITRSPIASDILKAMVQYYPLNIEPGGIPEYYTDCWWKHYWCLTSCHGPEVMAGFTEDGMNKYLADEIRKLRGVGIGDYTPIAASWYRPDVRPVKPPDQYVRYDLNTIGPRGRYGDFSFGGSIRKAPEGEHGRDTFVGAMLVDLQKLGTMDSALQLVTTEVRLGPGRERREARFISGGENGWVTIGKDCSGLSTDYTLTRPGWDYRSASEPWQGQQAWFLGKRRLVGLVSMAPVGDQQAYAVRGRIRLGMKAKPTDPERLAQLDERAFRYGEKMNIRIRDHNYGRIFHEPSETFYVDLPEKFRSTEIVLADPESERSGGKPVSYGAATRYYFLVEVYPYSSAPATSVRRIADGGVSGFAFRDEEGEFAVLHNPGNAEVAADLLLESKAEGKLLLHLGPEGGPQETAIAGGKARVAVPAHRHILCAVQK